MIKRIVVCVVCATQEAELAEGTGWPGWGQLQGVAIDGDANPHLCPACLSHVAQFVDDLTPKKGD